MTLLTFANLGGNRIFALFAISRAFGRSMLCPSSGRRTRISSGLQYSTGEEARGGLRRKRRRSGGAKAPPSLQLCLRRFTNMDIMFTKVHKQINFIIREIWRESIQFIILSLDIIAIFIYYILNCKIYLCIDILLIACNYIIIYS